MGVSRSSHESINEAAGRLASDVGLIVSHVSEVANLEILQPIFTVSLSPSPIAMSQYVCIGLRSSLPSQLTGS